VTFFDRLLTYSRLRIALTKRALRNSLQVQNDFGREIEASGQTMRGFLRARQGKPRLYVEESLRHLGALRKMPQAARAIDDAKRALDHSFDLLGSGPFVPVDPDRPPRANGYRPIDWYLDPVRQLRFPVRVPYKEWKLYEMRPAHADVKYPWELARAQHFIPLGQAWQMARDPRFAREIADQIADFMEANPVGFGINWTCTMDVAIRAANWALGLALIVDCDAIGDAERVDLLSALFDHGRFIYQNLENIYEVTSNHFLSNVVGLHFLAAEFSGLSQAAVWDEFCRKSLEAEINVQVHEEGADFESAVPYHRLVTELFLASARLAQFQGRPLSDAYHDRLARMVDFLLGVQRPDGLMPVIGDADDGRFHIMTDAGTWNRQDARHIYAPSALILGRSEWLSYAGPDGAWEAGWWGFDPLKASCGEHPAPDGRHLFPGVGIAVAREGGNYLAVTNGRVGTKGFGNHKHNELLSFEYHTDGQPWVVDPGSYVYTSDFAARNLFRSTAYHNTIALDGVEQNETNPEWIFRLFESADPEIVSFERSGGEVVFLGRHHGYQRIEAKATHERRFTFDLATGRLTIDDKIVGAGEHELCWHFHAAPGVDLILEENNRVLFRAGSKCVRLSGPEAFRPELVKGWYSPSYGRRVPVMAVDARVRVPLDGRGHRFVFDSAPTASI
jgi:hypothetical protein